MDYEKAYKEALERAKNLYDNSHPISAGNIIINSIFPELKESKDEKIRKVLINMFKGYDIQKVGEFTDKEIIAWLEKQGDVNKD